MPAPLFDRFHELQNTVRWCTPSIHPDMPPVSDIYANEMSISYHALGSPNNNTGVFAEAADLAAEAYQADHTIFGVNGTTGSNFVVIRALQEQMQGDLTVLSSRNIHTSVTTAAGDYRAEIDFIPPVIDDELQVFLPNSVDQILEGLRRNTPNVLLLSNPSYEGASVDLTTVVAAVREKFPDVIIYVDEAWGAHFVFSDQLPTSAMQAGADVCTQSTHKQGNSLQQTSMIHWLDGRIDEQILRRSHRALSTTSPSFHLLAALDASREFMQKQGGAEIGKLIDLSERFRGLLQTIGRCSVHSFSDPTKLLIHFPDRSAPAVAHELEEQGIISEKADTHNMLLIVGFQNTLAQAEQTAEAIENAINLLPSVTSSMPPFPRSIEKGEAGGQAVLTPIHEAVGRTCLEHVIPYPPGIPVLTVGERITDEHAAYLLAAAGNSQIEILATRDGHILVAE